MNKLYYEKRDGIYECVRLLCDGSDIIEFIFDTPLEAKLIINGKPYNIKNGSGAVTFSEKKRGECIPVLYSGGTYTPLEGFLIGTGVSRKNPNSDYIRNMSEKVFALKNKLSELEKRLSDAEEKINGKPII